MAKSQENIEPDPIAGNALRGHLETMVLSVLEPGEAHGFEVLKRLEEAGCGALEMKEGSLYPALYRLESAGCLKAKWEAGQTKRPGPRRRIYRITGKGRRKLDKGRLEWRRFVNIVGGIVGAPA
jgi:DNA-binding PadR family transcriptional regulator